jgi:hypothetical protein
LVHDVAADETVKDDGVVSFHRDSLLKEALEDGKVALVFLLNKLPGVRQLPRRQVS